MTNQLTAAYTDTRCETIAHVFGPVVAAYADKNLAGWVLDNLSDLTPEPRWSQFAGQRRCDVFAKGWLNSTLTALRGQL